MLQSPPTPAASVQWWKELQHEVSAAREAYAAAVEGLAEAHERLAHTRSIVEWLPRFPEVGFRTVEMPVDLHAPSGDRHDWASVMRALRRDAGE